MKTNWVAILATAFVIASAAPAFALNAQSGMPLEPKTVSGMCAKANMGVHIPYRGWRARSPRLPHLHVAVLDRSV